MRSAIGIIAVCLVTAGPSGAAPKMSADATVDTPVVAPAPFDQDQGAIAFGGNVYLAVWRDGRGLNDDRRVLAARFSPAGQPMDDPPIVLDHGPSRVTPSVCFDGKRFLVAWVAPKALPPMDQDVLAAYVDPMGKVSPVFDVASSTATQNRLASACGVDRNGRGLALLVWNESGMSFTTVHGALLDDAGAFVKDKNGAPIGDRAFSANIPNKVNAFEPHAAWGGGVDERFLVAWAEGVGNEDVLRPLFGSTLSLDGTVSAPVRISEKAPDINDPYITRDPAIVSDGTRHLVVWSNVLDLSLYGRAVSFLGAPEGTDQLLALPAVDSEAYRPHGVFVGGRFLYVWESANYNTTRSVVYGGRFDRNAVPLDSDGVQLTFQPSELPAARRSAIATDGAGAMAIWTLASYFGPNGSETLLLPISDPGRPLAPEPSLLASRGRNYQIARSASSNGNVFLLVWEDNRNYLKTGIDLYGIRIDETGKPTDPGPFAVCTAPGDQFAPVAAAYPGADFLVVWSDARGVAGGGTVELFAGRVGATKDPIDGDGFPLRSMGEPTGARLTPAVAAKSDGWLVAWEDWRLVPNNQPAPEVWSKVVQSDRKVLAEQRITTASSDATTACAPAVAWNGNRFLVAYEMPCSLHVAMGKADVRGRWVGPMGAVKAGFLAIAERPESETAPRLAADGRGRVIAVWRAVLANGAEAALGSTIDDDAAVPGTPVQLAAVNAGRGLDAPAVAFPEGLPAGQALVTWVEAKPPGVLGRIVSADLTAGEGPFSISNGSPLLAGPPPKGNPDPKGASLVAQVRSTPPASVVASPTGQALVAFDLVEPLPGGEVSRLHFRALGLLGNGAACVGPSACVEGICTGGRCCDTACDGLCQACGARGCVEVPAVDARCGAQGVISCGALSTTCRAYRDQPMNRCAAFGRCAEAGSLAECTEFTNAPDGTPCATAACPAEWGAGACRAGSCECGNEKPVTFDPRLLPRGCSVGSGGRDAPAWGLLGVALAAILRNRRRRGATSSR